MNEVTFQVQDGVGVLTVRRPAVRNALNRTAQEAFAAAVEQAHRTLDLRALILTGYGPAFISGGDLGELAREPAGEVGVWLPRIMGDALNRLEALPCPVIAAINGPARGGGAETALACDLRIMAEDATIGFVQVRLGLTTGWGGTARLVPLIGYAKALEILTTGAILDAQEALAIGLVNQVVPAGAALQAAHELAHQIAAFPPETLRAIKRLARLALSHPPQAVQQAEREGFPALWNSDYRLQAIQRFLAR